MLSTVCSNIRKVTDLTSNIYTSIEKRKKAKKTPPFCQYHILFQRMQYFGYACFIYEQFGFHQYIFEEHYWKIERCAY